MYCDAHLHPFDLSRNDPAGWNILPSPEWRGAVVSHDIREYAHTQELRRLLPPTFNGFGIHPQDPRQDTMEFISGLSSRREIDYIGEAGFDFFGDTPLRVRNEDNLRQQRAIFEFQAALAEKHDLPLIIHSRKGMDLILGYGRQLRRLRSVIFHSWPGRILETQAFLKQGINAYFSFGTTLLRGARHAIESCDGLDTRRILSETDAPWQPPRGCVWTRAEKIVEVVDVIASVRRIPADEAQRVLADNFFTAFGRQI